MSQTAQSEVKQDIQRLFLGAGKYVKGQLQVDLQGAVKINVVQNAKG